MPKLRESTTSVIVRGETWDGTFESEPYEAGWAAEAVVFLRLLKLEGSGAGGQVSLDVSADGIHWAAEGTTLRLPERVGEVTFARLAHFGNWLRVSGRTPDGVTCQALVAVHCKG
jgi:hypothetical protein